MAAGSVAGRSHAIPALPERPHLPTRVGASSRARPPGHHARRDREWPLSRPQSTVGAGGPLGGLPGRHRGANRLKRQAMTSQSIDLGAIKKRQEEAWAAGDYPAIGAILVVVSEVLCETADLRAGQRV